MLVVLASQRPIGVSVLLIFADAQIAGSSTKGHFAKIAGLGRAFDLRFEFFTLLEDLAKELFSILARVAGTTPLAWWPAHRSSAVNWSSVPSHRIFGGLPSCVATKSKRMVGPGGARRSPYRVSGASP